MTRRHCTAVGVLVIAVAGVVALYGQGQRGRFQSQDGGGWWQQLASGKLQQRLQLSPEQMDQIKQISASGRPKLFELSSTAAENRQALLKEVFSDKPNQKEINRRKEALQQVHNAQMDELIARAGEVNQVLTPEQRSELQRIIDEGAQQREQRRQRWMERTAPPSDSPLPEER